MLEHEPQETLPPPPTVTPASERRVSPEELTAALTALDASKQHAAQQLEGTVPIGQVVSEMGLDATPEEIWAQVQKQRAQTTANGQATEDADQIPFEQAAKQTYRQRSPAVPPLPFSPMRSRLRIPMLRRLSKVKGWVWIVFWCTGGFGLLSGLPHLLHTSTPITTSSQMITISGDEETETLNVQGKDVVVSGDEDKITLHGEARSVTVTGDENTLRGDAPKNYESNGDGNTVIWNAVPSPQAK